MGLLTIIQIPCYHVLSNEINLNLKYSIGLKLYFNINLGIGIMKKLLFCAYFWHISLCFCSNFDRESSLDVEFNFASNEYALGILLMGPATPKTRNTWKNVIMTCGRARWMRNLISHPTSTHSTYFWRSPLPSKKEIPEKSDDPASSILLWIQI